MPEVAVNIVTWNSETTIRACLDSVFAQTHRELGITVVDNGSADGSAALVAGCAERGVRLIRNETNRGYAVAHNQAIEATDSRTVLTLNPDVILAPTFIASLAAALDQSPRAGSAAARLLQISPQQFQAGDLAAARLIDSAGLFFYRSRRQYLRGHLAEAADHCLEPAEIFGPDGAAAFYRRAMLDDTRIEGEYFDSLFVTHKEDVDLAWRAQLLGWRSLYVPEAVGYHIRGFRPGQRQPLSPAIRRHAVKNRWLLLIKNELPGLFWRDWPFIAAYDLRILAYLVAVERTSLPALWEVVRLFGPMWRRRRAIQRRRQASAAELRRWFRGG